MTLSPTSRDSVALHFSWWFRVQQRRQNIDVWSLNAGGYAGFWRLVDLLQFLPTAPSVLMIQEAAIPEERWATVSSVLARLGCSGHLAPAKSFYRRKELVYKGGIVSS